MFTVALIGPDGCGKTTVATRLADGLSGAGLPLPTRYVYMGVNLETSNLILPTTWLWLRLKKAMGRRPDLAGPPDPTRRKRPKTLLRRMAASVKGWLRLTNLLGEELFRQAVIAHHRRRGRIVLLDRDFFIDYYAHDVAPPADAPRSWASRFHGFVLRRLYCRPDLVLFLDAPAELLFQRKGEGTVELLERRRQEYLRLPDQVRQFHTVDAGQPLDRVLEEVSRRIMEFHRTDDATRQRARTARSRLAGEPAAHAANTTAGAPAP
jgi:thymidylate kinase